jgi:hypothetical protein
LVRKTRRSPREGERRVKGVRGRVSMGRDWTIAQSDPVDDLAEFLNEAGMRCERKVNLPS